MSVYDISKPNQFKRLYHEYKKEKESRKAEILKSFQEELRRKKTINNLVENVSRKQLQKQATIPSNYVAAESLNHYEIPKSQFEEVEVGEPASVHGHHRQQATNLMNESADDAYARRLAMSSQSSSFQVSNPTPIAVQSNSSAFQPNQMHHKPKPIRSRGGKILLEGAVNPSRSTFLSAEEIKALQKDIVVQCNKYGVVTDFKFNPNDQGSCLITFKTYEMAEKAQSKLDGRQFENRQIVCTLLP